MGDDVKETWFWRNTHQWIQAVTVPGTDEVIRTQSTEESWRQWAARCNQLGMEFPNPRRTFEDCGCRALAPSQRAVNCGYIDEDAPEIIRRARVVGVSDVMRALDTAADWWRSEEAVTQEQANRRAETCRGCKFNTEVHAGGCASCTGIFQKLAAKVFGFIGNRSTPHDKFLGACGICKCSLPEMIWTPLDALLKNQPEAEEPPPWCWKTTERQRD